MGASGGSQKSSGGGFGGSRFGGGDDADTLSEINITPLVDVVLVLLIIFMITAPAIYQSAIKVDLPKAVTGESQERSELNFAVLASGDVQWNGKPVDWSQLGQELKGLREKLNAPGTSDAQQTAIVNADEKTPHGAVVKLMDALRSAGFNRFALSVEGSSGSSN